MVELQRGGGEEFNFRNVDSCKPSTELGTAGNTEGQQNVL